MAVISNRAATGGSAKDLEQFLLFDAASKLGVSAEQIDFVSHHLGLRGVTGASATATGTGAAGSYVDGAFRITKGTSINGTYNVSVGGLVAGLYPMFISEVASAKWYVAGYVKLDTAIGAGSVVDIGGIGNPSGLTEYSLGIQGGVSATNFVLWGRTGGMIDSGMAADQNWHLHRGWRDGTTTHYQIDSGSIATGDVRPTNPAGLHMRAFDSTATERAIRGVIIVAARVRPA